MRIVYRDTGVSKDTDVNVLKFIHNQFLTHHKTHTVALLCEKLEKNFQLVDYINSTTNWNLCIYGWTLLDYPTLSKDKIGDDVDKCILKIEELFNVTPEVWYLPNNGFVEGSGYDLVPRVTETAMYHGVDVDIKCEHIVQAVERLEGKQNLFTNTVFFNWWDKKDLELLPTLFFLTR